MALQDILKKILDEAQKQVDTINAELEAEKKTLQADSNAQEKVALKELEDNTLNALASIENKTHSMARQEVAKIQLMAKRDLIEKALVQFLQHLEKAPDALYEKILEKLVAKLTVTNGTIRVPKARLSLTEKKITGNFKFIADENIRGGFILESEGAEIDNSFHNLVYSEFKTALEMYFADQLKLV